MKNKFNWNDLTDEDKYLLDKAMGHYTYEIGDYSEFNKEYVSEYKEDLSLLSFYEIERYLSRCILAWAAIEAGLLILISEFPKEIEQTGKLRALTKNKKHLSKWGIKDLITCVKEANLISQNIDLNTLSDHRHLVHPYSFINKHKEGLSQPAGLATTEDIISGRGFRKSGINEALENKFKKSLEVLNNSLLEIRKKMSETDFATKNLEFFMKQSFDE